MDREEKKQIREAERMIVNEAGGSDSRWIKWMVFILVIEVLYIILEFGFNAALLNVASGLFPDPDTLNAIELTGRLLSGVGFGLLLYGVFAMRYKGRVFFDGRQAILLAGIMPFAMTAMYVFQEVLIEKVIVENSSDEDRFAAIYLNMIRPAIRNGTLILEDVPIDASTSDRPENKAFLAIAGMLMASNEQVVKRIPLEIDNIIASLVHKEALESHSVLYDRYTLMDQKVSELFTSYKNAQVELPKRIKDAVESAKRTPEYKALQGDLDNAYTQYQVSQRKIFRLIGSKTWSIPYLVNGSCNHRAHRNSLAEARSNGVDYCDISYKKSNKKYLETTGRNLKIEKFCDLSADRYSCDFDYERIGRIVYADMTAQKRQQAPIKLEVKGFPLALTKRQFYSHPAFNRNFRSASIQGNSLDSDDLVLNKSGIPVASLTLERMITKRIHTEFSREVSSMSPFAADNFPPGLSKNQFYRSDSVQRAYQSVINANENQRIESGLSSVEFLNSVLLPRSWVAAKERLKGIPGTVNEMNSSDEMLALGTASVRAMVVPPIALLFSLFFSLFTLSKVFHHLAAIQYIKKPKTFPLARFKLMINSVFLVLVIGFPYLLTDNPMIKNGIVGAATGSAGVTSSHNTWAVIAMDWMIRAEPAIYPFGNAMIGIPIMPFNKWHDENAQAIGTDDVKVLKTIELISSMSVIDAQIKLNKLGYNAGPEDGLMGRNTMMALKSFQLDKGLVANGIIDASTSLALMRD